MNRLVLNNCLIALLIFSVSCKVKKSSNEVSLTSIAAKPTPMAPSGAMIDLIGTWQTEKTWSDNNKEYPILYKIEAGQIIRTWHTQEMHCNEIQLSVSGQVYNIKCKMHYSNGEFDDCQFNITRGSDPKKATLDEMRGDVYLAAAEVRRQ